VAATSSAVGLWTREVVKGRIWLILSQSPSSQSVLGSAVDLYANSWGTKESCDAADCELACTSWAGFHPADYETASGASTPATLLGSEEALRVDATHRSHDGARPVGAGHQVSDR
jgi:hypothetical protein